MAPALLIAVMMFVPVAAALAIVGFGYVPERSPPAVPVAPVVIVMFDAAVSRPCASTLNVGTCVADPYVPAVTAVFASLAPVTEPSASFAVVTAASASLVVPTAPAPIPGLGYVPERSPPAVPVGGAPAMSTCPAAVRRPCCSTVNVATF